MEERDLFAKIKSKLAMKKKTINQCWKKALIDSKSFMEAGHCQNTRDINK